MKKMIHIISLAQVTLGVLTALAVSTDISLWWVPGIPWMIISIIGIVLTIPLVMIIGMGAGCAQADWMSDGFIITLCFVIPTTLSVGVNCCCAAWCKLAKKQQPDNPN